MSLHRLLLLVGLTVAMLTAGLIGPAAGEPAPVIPETVSQHLEGLPAAGVSSLSLPVTTPIPFSMVGFAVPAGTELEFRTSTDGEQWSAWTAAEGADPDEGPDPGSAEARRANALLTDPVWVGEATHLQTRAAADGPPVRPGEVGVELIDSAGLGRSWGRRALDRLRAAWRGTPPTAHAIAGQPPIVTRKQWGADEGLRRSGPYYASRIVMGVVHHTAGSNSYTRAESPAVVRGIYRYHTLSRGWNDVGYNFLIDRYGTIYEGRYGGIDRAVIGAHAGGFNTGTFGASMIGTFDRVTPPAAMQSALEQLLAWKYDLHHVNVLGELNYTSYGSSRYASGREVRLHRLSGHKDVSTTACPGTKIYAGLTDLRSRVAELQGPVLFNPEVRPTALEVVNGSSLSGPVSFGTKLRPGGTWSVDVYGPTGALVHTAAGSGREASAQWTPSAAARGVYRYVISSLGRRSVEGELVLDAPTISATASPTMARIGTDGTLAKPVTFSASLYDGARWRLSVTDPSGVVVHSASGSGSRATSSWSGRAGGGPGTYRWTLTADDVPPVTGSVELFLDRVERVGTAADAATAAAQISQATFGDLMARRVVLTRSDLPAFAVAAGPLARSQGPVLYTGPSGLPSATMAELRRVLPLGSTIYVLGNGKVISDAALADLTSQYVVQRIGDASPVRTAAAVADVVLAGSSADTALVVGNSGSAAWRQAVAAAAYGADAGVPILLTGATKLPPATRDAVARNGLTSVTVVGGTAAVSEDVRRQLPGASRVGGASPVTTARAVAARLHGRTTGGSGHRFLFVNAFRDDGWGRAFAAAPRGARANAPVLVVRERQVPTGTRRYLDSLGYTPQRLGAGWLLGGRGHATEATRDALSRHVQ